MHFPKPLLLPTLALTSTLASAANITNNGLGTTPAQRSTLSAHQAHQILSAATTTASNLSIAESIAVLSPSGYLIAFLAMDNAPLSTIDVAIKKARTTALTNGALSGAFLAAARGPEWGLEETNGGLVVFEGGLPVYVGGVLLGAVGCSGAPTAALDVEICAKGAAALE